MEFPQALYRADQTRVADRRAIEEHGMDGALLMERAGQAAFQLLRSRWPRARHIALLCGPGNNGGDGFVIARLAQAAGLSPMVMLLDDKHAPRGAALAARQRLDQAGVQPQPFSAQALCGCDVIVDALFGTGLEREIDGRAREMVEAINASGRPVLALDIPSGLHADSGRVPGVAVRAEASMAFIGLKAGMFTGAGREYCGALSFDGLDVPPTVFDGLVPQALRITGDGLSGLLRRRARHAHKGSAGQVTLAGGAPGMAGAMRLAGEAAYRTGAGLVRILTHPSHAAHLNTTCPELISYGVDSAAALRHRLANAGVLAAGPGLGQDDWAGRCWAALQESPQLRVVDADALNLLAQDPVRREGWILTPHPGEAARLLGCRVADIQDDRFAAVREIAASYGGVCVLKGSGTLVAQNNHETVWLCDRGNPGLATAGTGDVLTGVIAALCARGLSPVDAACAGVWLHASAADDTVSVHGEGGMMAGDLFPFLRAALNRLTDDPCF